MSVVYFCAECRAKACVRGGDYPPNCPSAQAEQQVRAALAQTLADPWTRQVLTAAAATPRHEDGTVRTRVEELIVFCRQMGYTTLGVAFCVSLARETNALSARLHEAGFRVVPVCCTVGGMTLADFGVTQAEKPHAACNPLAQAEILNAQQTDVNILVGLCVGHDILFARNSYSPVTTLVVKDRALKHHAVDALRQPPAGAGVASMA